LHEATAAPVTNNISMAFVTLLIIVVFLS